VVKKLLLINKYIIYKLIEREFVNDEDVIIQVSEQPDLRFDIFNKRFLQTHGDTLGGGGGGIAGILPSTKLPSLS
jgi:hypothetical protein